MPLRKLLITIMLWSLAATAVLGAFNALVGAGDAGWRFVGTGVTCAVAAGLMIPFSFRMDKPETHLEGVGGMLLVVVLFAGTIGLIWNAFDALGGSFTSERVGRSMLFLAGVGLPSVVFLRLVVKPAHRAAGFAEIALAVVTFTLLMIATWSDPRHDLNDDWLGTGAAVGGLGLLGVLSLLGMGEPPRRPWRWVGVVMALAAVGMALVGIWRDDIDYGSALLICVAGAAAVVAHANLCLLVPLSPAQQWIRVATIPAALATAAFVDIWAVAQDAGVRLPMIEKLASASGILAGCGSLALIVLAKLNKQIDRKQELSEIREVTVICPGCERKLPLPVGESACSGCGLKFSIKVEEPRCPQCDYLLFKLQSDRCPECGFEVTARVLPTPVAVQPDPVAQRPA